MLEAAIRETARDSNAPFVSVRGLAHYFDVSKPWLNRTLEGAPRLIQIQGAMPRLTDIPAGCAFNPRCPKAFDRCRAERPELVLVETSEAACWLYEREREVANA